MTVQMARQVIVEPTSLQMLFSDPRLAVKEDCIVCLICGARFRQLTNTHLRGHGTGVAEYRARFGYNRRRALMCRGASSPLHGAGGPRGLGRPDSPPAHCRDARAATPGRRAVHRPRGAAQAARGAATDFGAAPGEEGPRVAPRTMMSPRDSPCTSIRTLNLMPFSLSFFRVHAFQRPTTFVLPLSSVCCYCASTA